MGEGRGGSRGKVGRRCWHGGGEGSKILSRKGNDVIWFSQQQKLQEVSEKCLQFRVMAHVDSVVSLQLLLQSGKGKQWGSVEQQWACFLTFKTSSENVIYLSQLVCLSEDLWNHSEPAVMKLHNAMLISGMPTFRSKNLEYICMSSSQFSSFFSNTGFGGSSSSKHKWIYIIKHKKSHSLSWGKGENHTKHHSEMTLLLAQ